MEENKLQITPQITIGQLNNFVLVVEEKSFQAAAKRAIRSQPAISKSVKKLEEAVGGNLFEKSSNSTLTSLGTYFYPQAKDLLIQYEKVVTDIMLFANKEAGQVTFAVLPSVASSILPDILKTYTERYPNIQLNVQDENSETIHRRVLNGTIDFGISHLWDDNPEFDFVDMMKDPIGLVCSKAHFLAKSDVVTWEMLANHKFVSNGTARLLYNTKAAQIVDQAQLSIANMASLIAVLEANMGITTLPYLAFPQGNHQLCFRSIENPTIERTIGLISRHKFSGTPATQAMKEVVLEHFRTYEVE